MSQPPLLTVLRPPRSPCVRRVRCMFRVSARLQSERGLRQVQIHPPGVLVADGGAGAEVACRSEERSKEG